MKSFSCRSSPLCQLVCRRRRRRRRRRRGRKRRRRRRRRRRRGRVNQTRSRQHLPSFIRFHFTQRCYTTCIRLLFSHSHRAGEMLTAQGHSDCTHTSHWPLKGTVCTFFFIADIVWTNTQRLMVSYWGLTDGTCASQGWCTNSNTTQFICFVCFLPPPAHSDHTHLHLYIHNVSMGWRNRIE